LVKSTQRGDLNFNQITNFSQQQIGDVNALLLSILKQFPDSLQFIPPELRHMTYFLKHLIFVRYTSDLAVTCALSVFFSLDLLGLFSQVQISMMNPSLFPVT
jgi:hypothetical protein